MPQIRKIREPETTVGKEAGKATVRGSDEIHDPLWKARVERDARNQAGSSNTASLKMALPSART